MGNIFGEKLIEQGKKNTDSKILQIENCSTLK